MRNTLSISRRLLRHHTPLRVLLVVDNDISAELLEDLLLLFARGCGDDLGSCGLGELDGEEGDAAGSLGQDPVSWHQLLEAVEGVPGGEAGAGQGCGFEVVEVLWHLNETFLVEDTVSADGSIDDAAEAGLDAGWVQGTTQVALVEESDDPVDISFMPQGMVKEKGVGLPSGLA